MQSKDSKHLKRAELLEMLIEQSKEVESLKKQVANLQQQLEDRRIQMENVGSLAEAALTLNHIFKSADEAASQYIDSIKQMEQEKKVELQALRQKALDDCAVMREDTQEYCMRLRQEYEAKLAKEQEENERREEEESSSRSEETLLEIPPSVGGGVS